MVKPPVICDRCSRSFKSNAGLQGHLRMIHGMKSNAAQNTVKKKMAQQSETALLDALLEELKNIRARKAEARSLRRGSFLDSDRTVDYLIKQYDKREEEITKQLETMDVEGKSWFFDDGDS